ncbi:hypothetical protein Peur_029370 [Populus x canadensis]
MGYRGLQCVSTWGSLFQSKLSFYMCYFLGSFFVCFHWFFLLLYPISGHSQYLCLLALNSVLLNMWVLSIKHCRSCQVISFC